MRVEVDGRGLLAATTALAERGVELRALAAACEQAPAEAGDARLRAAVRALTDSAGDALTLAGMDLGLLAAKVRTASGRYADVELAVAAEATPMVVPGEGAAR